MFIIQLTYTRPLTEIDQHLKEHRDLLGRKAEEGVLLFSGPQNPRTGGIIAINSKDRGVVDALIEADPFHREKLAEYEVIEITLTKFDPRLKGILSL